METERACVWLLCRACMHACAVQCAPGQSVCSACIRTLHTRSMWARACLRAHPNTPAPPWGRQAPTTAACMPAHQHCRRAAAATAAAAPPARAAAARGDQHRGWGPGRGLAAAGPAAAATAASGPAAAQRAAEGVHGCVVGFACKQIEAKMGKSRGGKYHHKGRTPVTRLGPRGEEAAAAGSEEDSGDEGSAPPQQRRLGAR